MLLHKSILLFYMSKCSIFHIQIFKVLFLLDVWIGAGIFHWEVRFLFLGGTKGFWSMVGPFIALSGKFPTNVRPCWESVMTWSLLCWVLSLPAPLPPPPHPKNTFAMEVSFLAKPNRLYIRYGRIFVVASIEGALRGKLIINIRPHHLSPE